ncbi:Stk1 family PASTA domain-containing Ser/Thr kinase [Aeromicrobium sp. 9AM]|uniref:Stk1 family PASTA domain-containing Ser/Thr kinase n=1 Tax=Aeromicrobium sp. 9AM TaxID=2653126 RepID=UPI0012EF8F08|nr:Stk1 family PASTA domain-containing Ser/Thr kinase [Aeromicrobium sp. 9AM]VXC02598.1 Serine/threonine-protein kinase PK-1 [Aeromicrobium sp. 9AM]
MTVTGDDALVGRVLNDRYLIGERIARGGMASVFLAVDRRLDREVAIKVMHHGLGDDQQFTDRFVREAKSAAKLNHRNVVSVFDQGRDGDVTYLVMEYVPGRTLRDLMREEAPMPPYRALELLEQVLVALSAAHAAKIIHRDVKPENVLITPDGDVKVADFGLARAVSAATTATGGTLIGTVSYLAPEIVTNDGADARSDIYACGAMLYEMLTGLKPHAGESPIQVAYKHVHEDIGAPSAVQPGIPAYVDALVARATVRDRDQRSTDARVMLQQVRSVQRALDAGLTEDPDLVADLLPGVRPHDDEATVSVTRPVPPTPRSAASDSEATEAVHVNEATVQWSNGLAPLTPVDPATREGLDSPPVLPETADRPAGLHPIMSPEDYKKARAAEPTSHRGRNLLILTVLLALVLFAAGYWFSVGRYDTTPTLVGNAVVLAKENAEKSGFKLKVTDEKFSETAPAGTVMTTDPGPGDKILPGSTIHAVVSKGPDRVYVPKNLRGMTVTAATAALKKVDLDVARTKNLYSEKVDKGRVIGVTNYKVTDPLKRGTSVVLGVSKGQTPIEVKDYRGRPFAEAKAGLEDAGFKVKASEVFSDDVAKGSVVTQDPNDGTKFKGNTITLTVSKGPELILVPDMVGHTRAYAERVLKAAGFKVQAFGAGNFTIRAQNPRPGSERPKGSTITITFVGF